jgi:hypothetical protein
MQHHPDSRCTALHNVASAAVAQAKSLIFNKPHFPHRTANATPAVTSNKIPTL